MIPKPGDMIRVCIDGVTLEGGVKIPPALSLPQKVQDVGAQGVLTAAYGWVEKWVAVKPVPTASANGSEFMKPMLHPNNFKDGDLVRLWTRDVGEHPPGIFPPHREVNACTYHFQGLFVLKAEPFGWSARSQDGLEYKELRGPSDQWWFCQDTIPVAASP